MKKTLIYIALLIVFFLIYFLQANFFSSFTIAGIKPNLFIIFMLFIGLFSSNSFSLSIGVIGGLLIDSIYGSNIGITAVMLCLIGYLGCIFDRNFSKENRYTIVLMVIGCTIIYEFGLYGLNCIISKFEMEIAQFFKILSLEILYNSLLTIIIYPLFQKAGYAIESNFKRNNILTRYF